MAGRLLQRGLILALGIAGVGACVLAACQRYEFDEVTPVALKPVTKVEPITGKSEKPYVMLVVDKSGSMLDAASGTGKCVDGNGEYDRSDSSKPCKWNDLLAAFTHPTSGFLPQSKKLARFGLTVFPSAAGGCEAGNVVVPFASGGDADPGVDNAEAVAARLRDVVPQGGTPLAVTLLNVAQAEKLKTPEPGRKRFVMLLTDGQPNCNKANAQRCKDCVDLASCQRVPDGCWPTWGAEEVCDQYSEFVGAACLDDLHTVEAVAELRRQGVETFVIGFGLETAEGTKAADILNRAAVEGGHPRADEKVKYFQAGTRKELEGILDQIGQALQACEFALPAQPVSDKVLQVVLLDAEAKTETELVQGTDWVFGDSLTAIRLLGERCSMLQSAEPNRYALQFRFIAPM